MRTPTITAEPAVVYNYNGRRSLRRRTAAMRAARKLIDELTKDCGCDPYDPETGAEAGYCRFHSGGEDTKDGRPPREKRLFAWLVRRIVRKFQRAEAAVKAATKDTARRTVRASKARMRYGDFLRAKDSHPDLTFREFMARGFVLSHPDDCDTTIPRELGA